MRRWVCRLQLLMVLASAVIFRSESCGAHGHILLSQIRDSSNLEGQVPVFIYPRNRVARLYPQELGCLYVASYDSQTYPLRVGFQESIPTETSVYRTVAQQWVFASQYQFFTALTLEISIPNCYSQFILRHIHFTLR
jgi:hypothetical protein